jgi:hypothetical protein
MRTEFWLNLLGSAHLDDQERNEKIVLSWISGIICEVLE